MCDRVYRELGFSSISHQRASIMSRMNRMKQQASAAIYVLVYNFMTIQHLFFELIQVALGVRVCLSHSPTAEEWRMLYDIAKK